MNTTSFRRLVAPSVAALALGAVLTGCGAGNESSSGGGTSEALNGGGSTAQQVAMGTWRAGYQSTNSGVTVNYDPTGSGAGVEKFNANGLDFAGSDAALDPTKGEIDAAKKRCGADALEVPNYVSAIAMVFNLKGIDKLNLSPETAASIFAGKITKWNDPAIAADNDGVTLPDTAISPVHRSDESGTTKNFTDYLQKASNGAWAFDADKVWPAKAKGEASPGNSGVADAVKKGDGTIGYVDDSQAGTLGKVAIKVGSGFELPTADGAAKALEVSPLETGRPDGDIAFKVDRTTSAAGAYPLLLASYVIACPTYDTKAKADLVKGFLTYVLSDEGQQAAVKTAGSAPLPAKIQADAVAIIDKISAKG